MSEKLQFVLNQIEDKMKERQMCSVDHTDHTDYSDAYCVGID